MVKVKFRLLSVTLSIIASAYCLQAEVISVSDAQKVAGNFVAGRSQTKSTSSELKLIWTGGDTKASSAPFYVFATGDRGFVVIAGDDAIKPVLGYSDRACFDPETVPDGLRDMFEAYRLNVMDLRAGKASADPDASTKWSELLKGTKAASSATEIVFLNTALWGQNYPYNLQCPEYDETNCLTGCGATALSILMKYYKWPDRGSGTLS